MPFDDPVDCLNGLGLLRTDKIVTADESTRRVKWARGMVAHAQQPGESKGEKTSKQDNMG